MAVQPDATTLRILVARPGDAGATPSDAFDPDACTALSALGEEAHIEVVAWDAALDAENGVAELDLCVVDGRGGESPAFLAAIDSYSRQGPPVLAILSQAGEQGEEEELALRTLQAGASQCVAPGPDFAHVLCEAALEQVHAWQALREEGRVARHVAWLEGLNDAIVNRLPAALVVVDEAEAIVSVNPEASRIVSLAPSRAAGRSLFDVLPEALQRDAALGDLLASARRGEPPSQRRARILAGDRLVRAYDIQAQRLDLEGRVLLVLTDVTASERQAARIDELQRYNANLVQNMNSALCVIGADGNVQFANPVAEQLFGCGPGELIGRSSASLFVVGDMGSQLLERTITAGTRAQGAECSVRATDGHAIPVGLSCSPLRPGAGERSGAVVVLHDLRAIKQLERQVLQSEKLASIGELAAGVAHEINNPVGFVHANLAQSMEYLDDLDSIFGAVDALQRAIEKPGDANAEEVARASTLLRELAEKVDLAYVRGDLRKALQESQEGTERIRHIVRDLRGFSRSDHERVERADINECIESTANIVWTMSRHGIELVREYGEIPALRCRPMQIKQVVMNLLVNACQAIAERGEGASQPGRVRVCTRTERAGVVIEIRDNGVGISPKAQRRIFDPFFTTKDVGAGTGLGLSTSHGIVARHGGEIRVESTPGQGTTFEVYLPDLPEEPRRAVRAAPSAGAHFTGTA